MAVSSELALQRFNSKGRSLLVPGNGLCLSRHPLLLPLCSLWHRNGILISDLTLQGLDLGSTSQVWHWPLSIGFGSYWVGTRVPLFQLLDHGLEMEF